MINRHCVTHRGLKQLCTSYSLELSEYFFDRSSWMIVMMLVMFWWCVEDIVVFWW